MIEIINRKNEKLYEELKRKADLTCEAILRSEGIKEEKDLIDATKTAQSIYDHILTDLVDSNNGEFIRTVLCNLITEACFVDITEEDEFELLILDPVCYNGPYSYEYCVRYPSLVRIIPKDKSKTPWYHDCNRFDCVDVLCDGMQYKPGIYECLFMDQIFEPIIFPYLPSEETWKLFVTRFSLENEKFFGYHVLRIGPGGLPIKIDRFFSFNECGEMTELSKESFYNSLNIFKQKMKEVPSSSFEKED